MPYLNTWEPRGVYRKFSGTVSAEDFVAATESMVGDSRFDALQYVVVDYLGVSETQFSDIDKMYVRGLRIGAFQTNPRIRLAVVTDNETIRRSVQQSIDEGLVLYPMALFPTLDQANAWAGRNATGPQPCF